MSRAGPERPRRVAAPSSKMKALPLDASISLEGAFSDDTPSSDGGASSADAAGADPAGADFSIPSRRTVTASSRCSRLVNLESLMPNDEEAAACA